MVTHTRVLCSTFNPSKCTHTHTHMEQWAANAAVPGEQLGVRFLAQRSHLSRGIEGGENAGYFLEENKHNPRYLFNTVAKLTKNKASTGVDISQQHSSNDFMNYFTSKIDTIRDQIVTMQPSATVSHQIVHYRSPEEQFHSFSTIGEEELYKLVKSSKPTTCMG